MEARFNNGTSVSQAYGDSEDTELIAAFQYTQDAISFVEDQCREDLKNERVACFYVITDHLSGRVRIIRPKTEK